MAQRVVGFGELLKLLEGSLQVGFGGQRLAQHLHGATQVEEEVRVATFLSPGVDKAFFGFFEFGAVRQLFFEGGGRVEQGFTQVVVAAELARLQVHRFVLGLEVAF